MAEEEASHLSADNWSEPVFDFYCELCREDGKMLEAEGYCQDCREYLCITCYTHHRRSRSSRHHVLLDKSEMPTHTTLSHDRANKDISKKCEHHAGKSIEFYCKSHDFLGCSHCFIEGHRNCRNIENITKEAEPILESKEYKDFIQMLKQFEQRSRDNIRLAQKNLAKSKSCCLEAAKSVRNFRQEINSLLDELEESVIKLAENCQRDSEKTLLNVSEKLNTSLESVEKLTGDFDQMKKSRKVCEIYIKLKESRCEAEQIQSKLSEAEKENVARVYEFEPNTKLKEFLKSQNGLGNLSFQDVRPAVAQASPTCNTENNKAIHVADINARSSSDGSNCVITGSAVVTNNRLIIADLGNYKVKLLDTEANTLISELKVSSNPWDVTVIRRNQAAVTLYVSKKILLLSVSDTLKLDREITVGGECVGVAFSKNKLIVSYTNPPKLEIMDLSGNVMKRLVKDEDGNQPIKWPQYVCVSRDGETIYVSDHENEKIVSFNLEGEVKSVYSDSELKNPEKVCVDHCGNVYVCGYNSSNIHMLTADLTKIKIILTEADGLDSKVWSVSHCQEKNRLYVGMAGKNVKVYELSQ